MDYDELDDLALKIADAIVRKIPIDIADWKQSEEMVKEVVLDILLNELN